MDQNYAHQSNFDNLDDVESNMRDYDKYGVQDK